MYIKTKDATDLNEGVTDWMTFLPQVYNADSIGYRPDLIKKPITEWKELIARPWKGGTINTAIEYAHSKYTDYSVQIPTSIYAGRSRS